MDWERFEKLVRKQWQVLNQNRNPFPYTANNCLGVFQYFFDTYKRYTEEDHPPLKAEQVYRIMEAMPYVDNNRGHSADILPAEYPYIIDRYFETKYRKSNYRINHFFSGRIREIKLYEAIL